MRDLERSIDAHVAWRVKHSSATSRPAVTVLCVTKRPHRLDNAIANYERQYHAAKHLIVVTNSRDFGARDVQTRLRQVENTSLIEADEEQTLGACLNLGLERCSSRYLAKFDDDDRYGAAYLSDMVLAHQASTAVVVGKRTYFAYIEQLDMHVLRFPGHEFAYTSLVSGATLVIDLEGLGSTRFPDINVGEDTAFLDRCQRNGGAVFSADRFNYLQYRGTDNTWTLPTDAYLAGSVTIDPTTRAGTIDV